MANQACVIALIVLGLISSCYGQVRVGYYTGKCGTKDVESIIRGIVRARFAYEPAIVAFLLWLQFHDCLGNKVNYQLPSFSIVKMCMFSYITTFSSNIKAEKKSTNFFFSTLTNYLSIFV